MKFVKYQGLGNDFILLDERSRLTPSLSADQARQLCHRQFGVGADGVIFALGSEQADYQMRIFNADGSEPEMCGNGIRCLARFLASLTAESDPERRYRIETKGGLIVPQLQPDGTVLVDMGAPALLAEQIPTTLAPRTHKIIDASLTVAQQTWSVTCVNMGNPHCVTFVEAVADVDLAGIGPQFEHCEAFPERINTEFVQVIRRDYLKMRVWERGAGATLACGTGACATVVAAVLTQRSDRRCVVELPGGPLTIEWSENDGHVYMTGPAAAVFNGETSLVN